MADADTQGDGFIDETQFIEAFYKVGLKIRRESLEFIFDVMSERFGDMEQGESQFLNLVFFMGKLFTKNEHREVDEVDQTLQLIKAALIYKNVDFGVIFGEKTQEDTGKKGKGKKDKKVKEEKTGGEE